MKEHGGWSGIVIGLDERLIQQAGASIVRAAHRQHFSGCLSKATKAPECLIFSQAALRMHRLP
jgi:hypothetical protein